jgi:N-methylhydantoinase B
MTVACLAARTEYPALGMHGGGSGSLRQYLINDETVHSKGRYVLRPGDVITMIEPGGGGFGDPGERDRDKVIHDIREGAVSREAAARDYGIEVAG